MVAGVSYVLSEQRGVLTISGPDARSFLQGLVSNDVAKVSPDSVIHTAFLTPQGKYLHDFFIAEIDGVFHLDCEAARRADLLRRLSMYRLRSKVTLADATASVVVALVYGPEANVALGLPAEAGRARRSAAGGILYVDPRLAELGARALLPRESAERALIDAGLRPGDPAAYDRLRLSLGVPDGSRDLPIEKAILLESGFDELNGIDWQKGCYMGQELTARTRYRGLVRKRLLPVEIDGPAPAWGTPIMLGPDEAGEMRSACDGIGLALIRLEHLERATGPGAFVAGESRLTPKKPAWVKF